MSAPPPMSAPQVMAPPPKGELRFRRVHLGLGIVQMVAGGICITAEGVGYYALRGFLYGVGFWTGIIFLFAGACGIDAGRKNSRCHAIACMVLSIIGAVVAFSGIWAAYFERLIALLIGNESYAAKVTAVLVVCALMVVITIVHAAFTCASTCCAPTPQRNQLGAGYPPQTAGGPYPGPQVIVMQSMVAEPGFPAPHQPQRDQVGAGYPPQTAGGPYPGPQVVVMQPIDAEPGFPAPHQPQPPPDYEK